MASTASHNFTVSLLQVPGTYFEAIINDTNTRVTVNHDSSVCIDFTEKITDDGREDAYQLIFAPDENLILGQWLVKNKCHFRQWGFIAMEG